MVRRDVARYWRHPGLPDVDLLRARYVRHRYGRHTHPGYTFGVIEAGVEEWDCRGATHRAGPGGLAIVNPEEVHDGRAGDPGGWRYRVLYPPVELVADVAAELGWRRGTPYFPQSSVADPVCARALLAANRAAEVGDALVASSATHAAIAVLLCRLAVPRASTSTGAARRAPAAVKAARDILRKRLLDPPTLPELAAAVETPPFVLLRAFRATTGLPPHAYLVQERVRRARLLLDGGTAPAEAATHTGFADQAHLSRHFKRIVGVPPGAYRAARTFKTAPVLGT